MDQTVVIYFRFPRCKRGPGQSAAGGAGAHGGAGVPSGQQAAHRERALGVQRQVHRHQLPTRYPPGM